MKSNLSEKELLIELINMVNKNNEKLDSLKSSIEKLQNKLDNINDIIIDAEEDDDYESLYKKINDIKLILTSNNLSDEDNSGNSFSTIQNIELKLNKIYDGLDSENEYEVVNEKLDKIYEGLGLEFEYESVNDKLDNIKLNIDDILNKIEE